MGAQPFVGVVVVPTVVVVVEVVGVVGVVEFVDMVSPAGWGNRVSDGPVIRMNSMIRVPSVVSGFRPGCFRWC